MFERYTESAHRVILFARYEASQNGSPSIEPEHLLLGLLREIRPILSRLAPGPAAITQFWKDVREALPPGKPTSTSVDLPLSAASIRVLEFAAGESSGAGHAHVSGGHLLIGLLREDGSAASRLVRERGITREAVLAQLEGTQPWTEPSPAPVAAPLPPVTREAVQALVNETADDQLPRLAYLIRAVKALPARTPGANWGFPQMPQAYAQPGKYRYASRLDHGVLTVETHHRFEERDIDTVERWSFSANGKALKCTQEITVEGSHSRGEMEFDLS